MAVEEERCADVDDTSVWLVDVDGIPDVLEDDGTMPVDVELISAEIAELVPNEVDELVSTEVEEWLPDMEDEFVHGNMATAQ